MPSARLNANGRCWKAELLNIHYIFHCISCITKSDPIIFSLTVIVPLKSRTRLEKGQHLPIKDDRFQTVGGCILRSYARHFAEIGAHCLEKR